MPFPYDFPIDWMAESTKLMPLVEMDVAFATDPGLPPEWTCIEAYWRDFLVRRGRQHELDRMEAGTAAITLDNADRRFEPLNAGSPYWPNVRPMRRLRMRAIWATVPYPLFDGYVEEWPPLYQDIWDAVVPIQAVDGFKVLNLDKLTANWPQERSDVRIGRVLDEVGWPSELREISIGQSEVIAASLDAEGALQHVEDVVEAESGAFYVDEEGRAVFRDRHWRIKNQRDSLATFGDGPLEMPFPYEFPIDWGGERPYSDPQFSYDDAGIWNRVEVTREGGTKQVAEAPTSRARYFRRTLKRENQLIATDVEALAAAQWLLGHYREPAMRLTELLIKPQVDGANLWPQVLGRKLGDRIRVIKRPPGGGMVSFQCHIEGIEHRVPNIGYWETRWQLSPADKVTYWILGDPLLSVLGSTTRLAY